MTKPPRIHWSTAFVRRAAVVGLSTTSTTGTRSRHTERSWPRGPLLSLIGGSAGWQFSSRTAIPDRSLSGGKLSQRFTASKACLRPVSECLTAAGKDNRPLFSRFPTFCPPHYCTLRCAKSRRSSPKGSGTWTCCRGRTSVLAHVAARTGRSERLPCGWRRRRTSPRHQ